jgi:hypothetical protein
VMAADAASTLSPLVKRLRMMFPSCGCSAGHHAQVAWAVKLRPAAADDDVGCYCL